MTVRMILKMLWSLLRGECQHRRTPMTDRYTWECTDCGAHGREY